MGKLLPLLGAVVLAVPLTVVAGAGPAAAATVGVTVAGGNGQGSAANQLDGPFSVAVDAGRNVYVVDEDNERVQRWAPGATSGTTVAGGNGPGSAANQFAGAHGVALDGNGNVYVDDANNNRIQRWAPGATSGVTVAGGNGEGSAANQLDTPFGLAVDSSANVYVADGFNDRIQRWAPGATSGVTVAGGNGRGSAANQLDIPFAVAVDSTGIVYVADTLNNRVQRWAPGATSGTTVAGGNGAGGAANQLSSPTGLAVDASDNVYIADGNARVQWWAPGATSGTTLAGGNGQGSAANQFNNDSGVALDGDGNVYVADLFNNRIQRWDTQEPTVLPGTGSVVEGNSGTTTLNVPVTLSNPWTQTVTIPWTTVFVPGAPGNQADPATDYTPASGTVTLAPGQSSATVAISVNGDTLVEPDEFIDVSFHDPSNALISGSGSGVGTIVNDDHAIVVPGGGVVTAPSSGTADLAVTVTLSNPSTLPITVPWTTVFVPGAPATIYGPEAPASDYTSASGTVTFAPGQTSAEIHISVTGSTFTPAEYVVVSFHNPTNAHMGGFWGLGMGFILPAP